MIKYTEVLNVSDSVEMEVQYILAKGKTPFAEYLFFESKMHGVCVSLDGDIQSCESDEGMYHEALVHPAMLAHPNPKVVLIMGGGEGATAREVLRHKSVQKVVMVDIDEEFVSLCKTHIKSWGKSAYSDPRLEVLYMDINEYLRTCNEKFDIVIGDLIDVDDWDSPAAFLYGEDLYKTIKPLLNTNAIIATQGGALDTQESRNHKHIREMMARVFGDVRSYGVIVPSFYHLWGYVIASDDLSIVDKDLSEKFFSRAKDLTLDSLGVESLVAAFTLPKQIKKNIGI
ncbi:methyltransferase domain-containing protein [Sulfurimonas sp. SAG-AH-194-C21]|nr:methyltransferase domain-containing protein [Sulfurimonas sp. SAG-AH-194-C21]MDF1883452.1 methyltransferase domain-containing protein [Sulfurimonas sp. SAG-AH-194-C21]